MSQNALPEISIEEKALKARLQGLTVSDATTDARDVNVFFRNPNKEIEESDFPFLTIFFTGSSRAVEREHSSVGVQPVYLPWAFQTQGEPLDEDNSTRLIAPLQATPVDLNFTVATHTRNPMHDRQLIAKLQQYQYLPYRYGWLDVDEDNSTRRLDVQPRIVSADYFDSSGVPIFRKEFNITVSAEHWVVPDFRQTGIVETVDIDIEVL